MLTEKSKLLETAVIHEGYDAKEMLGSLTPPLFQTSTYTFDTAEQGERRFAGEEEGYVYSRLGNPTVNILEERMAALEGGERGLAFASGMAAVSAVLVALTKSGDHILCSSGLYGCTFGLLQMMEEKYQIAHDFSQMESKEAIHELIRPETACISEKAQETIGVDKNNYFNSGVMLVNLEKWHSLKIAEKSLDFCIEKWEDRKSVV